MVNRKQKIIEKKQLVENVDYYNESGNIVFTAKYHTDRGYCCGNKCRHCPYEPAHEKGNKKLKDDK
jgi:hypothetical protein